MIKEINLKGKIVVKPTIRTIETVDLKIYGHHAGIGRIDLHAHNMTQIIKCTTTIHTNKITIGKTHKTLGKS